MLSRWYSAPHASRWFGGPRTAEAIADDHAERAAAGERIASYVLSVDGRDAGFFEWCLLRDHPDVAALYLADAPGVANCDVLLGEPDVAHRGVGPLAIRAFLREIVFAHPEVTGCLIDPHPENAVAIRAYEKAGFRFVRSVPEDGEGWAVFLLELHRHELDEPPAPAPFFLRPSRPEEIDLAGEIDEDACTAYAEIGLPVIFPDDHPFAAKERARWIACLDDGGLLFACEEATRSPVGFAAFGRSGGAAMLSQVSVRRGFARRGVGRLLVERAKAWAVRDGALFLTTYADVPWNRPMYERMGFSVVDPADAPPWVRAVHEEECAALPAGDRRVVMVHRHPR